MIKCRHKSNNKFCGFIAGNKKEYQSHLVDHFTKPIEDKRRGILSFFRRK